jgi:hypothetical protein
MTTLSKNCDDYKFGGYKYPPLPAPPSKVISSPPGTPQSVINSAIKSSPPGSLITIRSDGGMDVTPPDLRDPRDIAALDNYNNNCGTLGWAIDNPGWVPVSDIVFAWNCADSNCKNVITNSLNAWVKSHPGFDPQWFLKNPSNTEIQSQSKAALATSVVLPTPTTPQAIQANTTILNLPTGGGAQPPIDSSNAGSTPNSTGGYITQVETDIKQALSSKVTYVLLGGVAVMLLSLYVMSKEE